MKQRISYLTKVRAARPLVYYVTGISLVFAATLPVLMQSASAAQVQSRSVETSNSNPGQTGVTYTVSFIPETNHTLGGIVVDFCLNDPIVGDTSCTFPTGFTLGSSASVSGLSGIGTGGSWVTSNSLQCAAPASNLQTLLYTNTTAQTPTNVGTTPISFNITGVTNPTTAETFYARILTFDTSAHTTAQYTCTTTTRPSSYANEIDYGGVALSTANTISVTAKVQEQITFCVYTSSPQASCSGTTNSGVTLGTNGVLSSTAYYINNSAVYNLQTNAQHNAVVNVSGATLTGPGSATIPGINATTAASATVGNSDFGICTYAGTANSGTTGSFTAASNYSGGSTACNSTNVTSGAGTSSGVDYWYGTTAQTGTYGDTIATQGPGTGYYGDVVPMLGSTSTSQTAGIYTATLDFIATGTY